MLVLIDNYDSFTFNLYHLTQKFYPETEIRRNDQVDLEKLSLSHEKGLLKGLVLSPGPGRPEQAGQLLKIIEKFLGKVPILGICLGHQALGLVFGGKVDKAPEIMHGKKSIVLHNNQGLFHSVAKKLSVARYHSLCVCFNKTTSLSIDATTENEVVMGIRNDNLSCYGLQFHPESVLTEKGDLFMQNFIHSVKKGV